MYQLRHVIREVAANAAMGIPAVRAIRTKRRRITDSDLSTQARQMRDQFAFFANTLGDIRGKIIVEIGPGDTIGLGAQFLAAGASRYIAFDRFPGNIWNAAALSLYRELGCEVDRSRVTARPAIEDIDPAKETRADIIVSFDVMEHVTNPHAALRNMAGFLKPDGVMIHRIDYSPHDVWRSYANGFAFLAIPDWLWNCMGNNRGYPNRVRHVAIMETLRELGFRVSERITRRFTEPELREARPRLLPRFAALPDEELKILLAEVACCRTKAVELGAQFPY